MGGGKDSWKQMARTGRVPVVMHNFGGRITQGLLEQLGLLGRIGEVAGQIP